MKFTISADELDIAKIQIGQSVQVTADALEGQRLSGRITAVSKLGTASNGVTNYPIEVTIDEPGELMPGMNVSAEIIVEQSYNTLYLPVEAVEYFGGKYYVTVVGEVENMPERPVVPEGGFGNRPQAQKAADEENKSGEKAENTETVGRPQGEGFNGQRPEGNFGGQRPEGEFGGQRPEGGFGGQRPEGGFGGQRPQQMPGGEMTEKPKGEEPQEENKDEASDKKQTKAPDDDKKEKGADTQDKQAAFPDENNRGGFGGPRGPREELKIKLSGKEERVEVQVGISTDEYYEIISGVEYGQVVKNTTQVSSSSGGGMMGRMPGGMMGGMPGGMPGGMGGNRSMGGNRNMGGNRMGGR